MHREIFDDSLFHQFASSNIIVVNADFPCSKKNQFHKEQQALNDKMADTYNKQGAFPYTILLDANRKVIKQWDGCTKGNAASFIEDIKEAINANGN